ncbi:MAG: prephenate dehydrogenase [Candidatus Bathyarchaeia archaeon]|jgi:prephenate dehydrogenase
MAVATIIGGAGRMGSWFADFLSANGYRIIICDRENRLARGSANRKGFEFMTNEIAAAQLSQLVILTTPTHVTVPILKRIEPHISRRTLLVEISSVKEPIKRTIRGLAKRGFQILSIHPMFGPGPAKNLAGKAIIIAHQPRGSKAASNFLSLFRKRQANIIPSNLEDHDQIVAATLALPHFMNFAFINTLKGTGLTPNQARAIAGTTFRLQLLVAEELYHERLENEVSILADNKYSTQLFKEFVKHTNTMRNTIHNRTRSNLIRNLREGAAYVRKDNLFSTAYDRFTAAVEASNSP